MHNLAPDLTGFFSLHIFFSYLHSQKLKWGTVCKQIARNTHSHTPEEEEEEEKKKERDTKITEENRL